MDGIQPSNEAEAYRNFRDGYEKQIRGEVNEAMQFYRRSIEILPTAEAHTFLGWALGSQKKFDEAIEECKKAIEIDPDYGNPYNDTGAYLIEQEKYDEAEEWLERAAQAPRYDAKFYAHYNLGRIWEYRENWYRALSFYQEAYRLNPDYRLAEQAIVKIQGKLN